MFNRITELCNVRRNKRWV